MDFYEYEPPDPDEQHKRLVALRQLTSHGIPCILWAEDALCYVHRVATVLFDQQIIVPDHLLDAAAAILQEGRYVPAETARDYAELDSPHKGSSPFPLSIRLCHLDIPDDDRYRLAPLPRYILLHPQSYFGLDVSHQDRFQSLVPPLDPSNSAIRVPKYHTFLEGLIHFIVNPPTGILNNPHHHMMGRLKHAIFVGYLVSWRVQYEEDQELPLHELLPEEQKILDELQTTDARWYMRRYFYERTPVKLRDIMEYLEVQQRIKTSRSDPSHHTQNLSRSGLNSISPALYRIS